MCYSIHKTYDTLGMTRLIWKKYDNLVHIAVIHETDVILSTPGPQRVNTCQTLAYRGFRNNIYEALGMSRLKKINMIRHKKRDTPEGL